MIAFGQVFLGGAAAFSRACKPRTISIRHALRQLAGDYQWSPAGRGRRASRGPRGGSRRRGRRMGRREPRRGRDRAPAPLQPGPRDRSSARPEQRVSEAAASLLLPLLDQAPVIVRPLDETSVVTQSNSLQLAAADADGDAVTFSAVGSSSGTHPDRPCRRARSKGRRPRRAYTRSASQPAIRAAPPTRPTSSGAWRAS